MAKQNDSVSRLVLPTTGDMFADKQLFLQGGHERPLRINRLAFMGLAEAVGVRIGHDVSKRVLKGPKRGLCAF